MKIAVMQPYFFPYMGYLELMSKVDLFVIFDDVQYIRRGWINRNRTKINSEWWYFTIPVVKSKQKDLINQIMVKHGWSQKHIKTFENVFGSKIKNCPLYEKYKSLDNNTKLLDILMESLHFVADCFKIKCKFELSSNFPSDLKKQERIIDICKKTHASEYWNLPGGRKLYDASIFEKNGISLNFIDECVSVDSCLTKIFTAI
jgi:hypothetical protein